MHHTRGSSSSLAVVDERQKDDNDSNGDSGLGDCSSSSCSNGSNYSSSKGPIDFSSMANGMSGGTQVRSARW